MTGPTDDPVPSSNTSFADLVLTAVAALVMIWPLWSSSFAARDAAFTAIAMQSVVFSPTGVGCPLAWPQPWPLTQSDWVLGQGLMAAPLLTAGLPVARAHDVVVAVGLVATALAGTLLSRRINGPGAHNAIAGVCTGLSPIVLAHGQHVNLVHHELPVFAIVVWWDAAHRRDIARAALAGLLTSLSVQFGAYIELHALVLLAGLLPLGDRRTIPAAVLGATLGATAGAPIAWMYLSIARDHSVTIPAQELRDTSWHLADTLRPLQVLLHSPLSAIWPVHPPKGSLAWMNPVNPGYAMVGWIAFGVRHVRANVRRCLLLTLVVAAGLSIGPELVVVDPGGTRLPGPWTMVSFLPGISALREPARWWMVAGIVAAPFAAAGLRYATRALTERGRVIATTAAVALALAETPSLRTSPLQTVTPEPVYAELQRLRPGPLYDEALRHDPSCAGRAGTAILAAGEHHRPLVGAHYARRTAFLDDINRSAGSWPSDGALATFRRIGVSVTLEHPPLRGTPPPAARCVVISDHRLCEIQ
jgi:hypothetical protein